MGVSVYGIEVGLFSMWWCMVLLVVLSCGYWGWVFLVGLGLRYRLLWFWVLLVGLTLRSFGGFRVEV